MSLPTAFDQTILVHACPHRGHHREGTGSWFKSISYYECKACGQRVRVGYEDKVVLFEAYEHGHSSGSPLPEDDG